MTTTAETASLAPAAGAGIGKMLADLLLADPEFIPLMRSVALGCLNATVWRWSVEEKKTVEGPDHKIRSQMFFGLLAHMEGEPIKRIIHQHLGGTGVVDPLAALQESPALREAARAMLDKADYRTGGGKRAKARAEKRASAPTMEL